MLRDWNGQDIHRLLSEGTEVFRPTLAEDLGEGVFKVLAAPNHDPENETWEFPPGSLVQCEQRMSNGQNVFIAIEVYRRMG